MRGLRVGVLVSLVLGALSLVAVGACHLALTDIWHGEGDLAAEWRMLRIGALAVVAFQVAALTTLGRVLRLTRSA